MALYTRLSSKQITAFTKEFPLPPPSKIKGILEGTVNTFYRLTDPNQTYYLKIDEVGDLKRLKRELAIFKVLKKIEKKLICEVSQPLPTRSGRYYLPWGKKFVLLFKAVPGKTLRSANLKQIGQIAKALGQLHNAT